MTESDWLNRRQAAAHLTKIGCPVTASALANWVSRAKTLGSRYRGPPYYKTGWFLRYHRAELDAWAARNVVRVE